MIHAHNDMTGIFFRNVHFGRNIVAKNVADENVAEKIQPTSEIMYDSGNVFHKVFKKNS